MKNLLSSPRATRLLAVTFAWIVGTVAYAMLLIGSHEPSDGSSLIAKLCVTIVFSSIFLWCGAYKNWKAWLIEYRYGLRLSKMDETTTNNELPSLQTITAPSDLFDQPVVKEKLSYPWPSIVCTVLLFVSLFQWLRILAVNELSLAGSTIFLIAFILISRPYMRWAAYFAKTSTFEHTEANENSFLSLNKYLTQIVDSNFYRFQKRRLTELGFQPLGQQRHRHFFVSPFGDVIAILGRENPHNKRIPKDFMSLISIDEQGCIHESSSLNHAEFQTWADCHELWRFQSLDTSDLATTLLRHQEFVTAESSGRQFVISTKYRPFAKYFHEVTSNAKVRYYNEYQVSFA